MRFRCSRTSSTLRSGSQKPPFSTRPDLNLDSPLAKVASIDFYVNAVRGCRGVRCRFRRCMGITVGKGDAERGDALAWEWECGNITRSPS
ncbi:hypothetical protein EOA27_28060 [Mesorhizobium sp. M2A.F.Ca.ET.037.01.1.1]|nr:hypothetical protein EOA27_28060 [Mesorhizobium sp. M2A.F.Ca.ET.037.01.1.1]RUX98765.1 hypothetical protein EOA25_27100 [Mesorhizobium sp. M2A.F.Ca.ET.040.01.1.1]RVC66362.1 hypothetical protein EN759_19160 [Mesorhizobium sp. M00.F.Ca.ET.038.03.1.1]RVC74640.1 hypothetical protein EN766_17930 [Mesorhizobium sp. M2A.F.Ca.ET.046.02.1.1]RWA93988.1 MAG: hypothetical protein EOQ31_02605 [Mesorhizobium sp.]RWX64312.1 hypothetical protein EOA24_23355 [Mesorhizobium sp. M2A.F.Ca.ET.039.01.1.1]